MSGESVDKDNDDGDGTTCNRGNNLGIIENDGQLDREPKILKGEGVRVRAERSERSAEHTLRVRAERNERTAQHKMTIRKRRVASVQIQRTN